MASLSLLLLNTGEVLPFFRSVHFLNTQEIERTPFVLFRLIKNRSFNLLCVLDLFFRTLAVNSGSDFFLSFFCSFPSSFLHMYYLSACCLKIRTADNSHLIVLSDFESYFWFFCVFWYLCFRFCFLIRSPTFYQMWKVGLPSFVAEVLQANRPTTAKQPAFWGVGCAVATSMSRIGHPGKNTSRHHLKVSGNYRHHSSRTNSKIDLSASLRPPKADQSQHGMFEFRPPTPLLKKLFVSDLMATRAERLLLMTDWHFTGDTDLRYLQGRGIGLWSIHWYKNCTNCGVSVLHHRCQEKRKQTGSG